MNNAIVMVEVVLLVLLSAVCSGLNVSLIALDLGDIRRKAKLGDSNARKVLRYRKNLHLSLAAVLLTNVAAVSATSLVLESVLYGLFAGLISTLLIVIFGEILPQAFFSRRALAFTAKLSPILRIMIIVTYPVSKPLQLLLDHLLKDETEHLQTRRELGMMIAEHLNKPESELDEDEVEIIRGALQLSEKRVRDIMTPIAKVYWLRTDDILDNKRIDDIKRRGWSRIPVLNKARTTCYGLLLVKQLVDINFEDEQPWVEQMTLHPTQVVGSMTALDTMFRKFISAHTHLMPVEKDDHIVGIVTIEDLIEEIVGQEIQDETDSRLKR